jgi:hypothetical protein
VVVVSSLHSEGDIGGKRLWHVHVLWEPVVLDTRTSPEEGAVSNFVHHFLSFLRNLMFGF